jgi:phage tail-like protein
MAANRERPYVQFNFQVDLGEDGSPWAGFQELSGIGMETTVSAYRDGNANDRDPIKISGSHKPTDVTLKRGVIGARMLYDWLEQIRKGGENARRTVTIRLLSEDHASVVQSWKLLRARIVKHTAGPLNAKATDVAMEELVLSFEGLEVQ